MIFQKESWGCRISLMTLLLIFCLFTSNKSTAQMLTGIVNKEHIITGSGTIIDEKTGRPVQDAVVSIPALGIKTRTNRNGMFQLDVAKQGPLILSVEAEGYSPFSLVIDENTIKKPLKIAIEEQNNNKIVIDSKLRHLGDDSFSYKSANAGQFSIPASGPYFFKEFFLDDINVNKNGLLTIGSIIGIDTKIAQRMGQSGVSNTSASPAQVFLNSKKIGEIEHNGNEIIVYVPAGILRPNTYNHIRIETGINLGLKTRKDYDDIEFKNIFLSFK